MAPKEGLGLDSQARGLTFPVNAHFSHYPTQAIYTPFTLPFYASFFAVISASRSCASFP
jgi:hypothetical protein